MRCHRCHSKIDPGRKMCPVCGTLVKKPRGVKATREAGGSALGDFFMRAGGFIRGIDLKLVLAFLCGAALVAVVLMTFNCGSCDRSGGFSSCGSPGSCAACDTAGQPFASCASCAASCRSCGESCSEALSCASSDSDAGSVISPSSAQEQPVSAADNTREEEKTEPSKKQHSKPLSSVEARPKGASCAGNTQEDETVYEKSVNSTVNGREYFYGGRLYYINDSGICLANERGETELLVQTGGVNSLCVDNGTLYYLRSGELWSASAENGTDNRCVIKTTGEASENNTSLSRVYGFGVYGGTLCIWGPEGEDGFAIVSRAPGSDRETVLYRGQCAQQTVYRGKAYYLSREEDDFNTLYSVPLDGGRPQEMIKLPVSYYALCDGCVFAYTWIDSAAELYKIDCETLKALNRWDFVPIRGMSADDSHVWYYCNNADGTSGVFSINPDGSGNRQLFADHSVIQLGHVSGKYYSLYTNIDETADNRLASARYFIIDSETGDKRRVQ